MFAYVRDEVEKIRKEHGDEAAKEASHAIIGGMAGAAGGGMAGMAIGTAILPGIGTTIGAAVGMTVGLIQGARDKTAMDNAKTIGSSAWRIFKMSR